MKKILLIISCLGLSILASAQSPAFEWAKNMGGYYGTANGNSVAKDNAGNIYTTGLFQGTCDFDPGLGTFNLTAAGGNDIFILKTDANGNFIWAKRMGGTANDQANSITVDGSGNVYTTGYFFLTADFDPGVAIFNLTATSNNDIFISKLDAAGNFVWAKQMGGTSTDAQAYSIALDGSGNVYTTGYFDGTADFDPGVGTFNLSAAGNSDIFISKLDAAGTFVWARKIGGTSFDKAFSIALDGSGNIYTTGSFFLTADFDPGAATFNLTAASLDIFISKLDAAGNFVWAKQLGGSSIEVAYSIVTDGSGNIYTTGIFDGTVDFDPGGGTFNLTSAGSYDVFISKLDLSGNFIWGKQLGGTLSDYGNSVSVDGSGNIFIAGNFQGTADFDPGAGTFNLTSINGSSDIFISKIDAFGNFVWAKQMQGNAMDWAYSISVDGSGNVYSTGFFRESADFDPGAGVFNLKIFGTDNGLFISKLDASGNFVWAKSSGTSAVTYGKSVKVDLGGNVYTTGYFYGTVDFDPGAGVFNLISASAKTGDVFISKVDASGNFIWAKQLGGSSDDQAFSIVLDGSGNVYTCGYFSGVADFDPGAGTFNLTSAGSLDIFISKLDGSGNFVWAKQMGGTSDDRAYSMMLDGSGNIYITGLFYNSADFDPGAGTFNLTGSGSSDIFISKLDASGNFVWAKKMGGTLSDWASSIAVDGSSNVYTTGVFNNTADFDPGAAVFNLTSSGFDDVFVSKLDASGNFVWAKRWGGASWDQSRSIALDGSGNVYTTGSFQDTVDFDPGAATFNLTSFGGEDISICKLDASGNFAWARQLGGVGNDLAYAVSIDGSGNAYTTGYGAGDFDPGPATYNLTPEGAFISKLDASGNFAWAKRLGSTSADQGYSITVDGAGNVFTTGKFEGTGDFDPDPGVTNLTASGKPDMFVHKMSPCSLPPASISPSGSATFCSGTSIILNANTGTGLTYQWKNNGTNISGATNSAYTATAAGSYTVVVTNPCGSATSSAVTVTVSSLPSATITPAGLTTFCSGGSVVLNAPTGTNKTYQWKKNANLISGATLSSYNATTGGNYKVIVTNNVTGCSKTTASPTVVTINTPASTITPQGPTTFCAGGSVVLAANTGAGLTYKWKKGSNFISGATLSNYTATIAGTYKVEVTNSNGCSKLSSGVTVTVPCKEGEIIPFENNFDFSVYPNPNSGEFTIKFSNELSSPVQIEMTDEIGRIVKQFATDDETIVMKEANLAKGIYCLTARNKDEMVIKKISVVK